MTQHWQEKRDDQGILWLGLDYAHGPVNLLAGEVLEEFGERLDRISPEPPPGLVIHSRKEKGFIAGADVTEFSKLGDEAAVAAQIRRVHAILDRLEALPCPALAMIHGFCLGGGLELALACRYRVASEDAETRIGFPEVRLGIFPGYGGTWRGIRELGALPALEMMLTGRALGARQARRLGLVDLVVPRRQLEAAALSLLQRAPRRKRPSVTQRLPSWTPMRRPVAALLEHRTRQRVNPAHYPAPFSLIDHWRENGADGPALLESEAQRVASLLTGDTAQNLIRVFRLQERLKALGRTGDLAARRVHVVGAGIMGGDIAAWCALRGLRVTLQDVAADQLARAMKRAHALFEKRLRDPYQVRDAWDRLMPDLRGDGLAGTGLVIEAIVEDADAKRALLADIEGKVPETTLLATNTSSIPLETLGEGLRRPQRLIGLHFFNPVDRMQLVEVVHGRETADDALKTGLGFVRAIDRLPLPVRSSPGFLVNRVLMPYLLEAMELLEEGVPPTLIDRAAVDLGMPVGPIALADSVGLDICLAVAEKLGAGLTAPQETPSRLSQLVRAGRLGRKSSEGFYRYKDGHAVKPRTPRGYRPPPDLGERMIFRLINEAVACLREGVVEDADLLDAGVIFGTGFAPFRGGPMHYVDQGGWSEMRERLESLQRSHGGHFRPDPGWYEPLPG